MGAWTLRVLRTEVIYNKVVKTWPFARRSERPSTTGLQQSFGVSENDEHKPLGAEYLSPKTVSLLNYSRII